MNKGHVTLAGAGPGHSGLVTTGVEEALSRADVVVYDYLASHSLIEGLTCEKVYVGKEGGNHTLPQEEITSLLISYANEGKNVVRLKGGDPYIFGRGGEEAEALVEADIPFTVLPGISSFYAAPAFAGIPVTHRDHATGFVVITGHRRSGMKNDDILLPEFDDSLTYIFLMGMKNLQSIAKKLMEEKHFPGTVPAAVIQWGTRHNQVTVTSTLENLYEDAQKEGVGPPSIIMVGSVITMREKLRWFDKLPLFGKEIVVTRTRSQASKLSSKLSALGADVLEFPTIEIEETDNQSELLSALDNLSEYNWIIFTSQNAAAIFFDNLKEKGLDSRSLGGVKIAVIGPGTGDETAKHGILPDLMPEEFVAEGLLKAIAPEVEEGMRILLPCSADARMTLTEGLEKMGCSVSRIHIYKTVQPKYENDILKKVKEADLVTVTSSSTAKNFFELVPDAQTHVASIGPITSKAVENAGKKVAVQADTYTINGLVDAVLRYFGEKND